MRLYLEKIANGEDLSASEMTEAMQSIMTGQASDAQIGGFLVGLRSKGETVVEIAAAASVMRGLSTKVPVKSDMAVDTCGTGGDGANLFNVSTASAFVVAALGGKVAKHGNRSVSSSTGSADVLAQAGVSLTLTPEQIARAVDEIGVGFMFAPAHHSAMKYAISARRELGIRTIFNLLGPMTNPASVRHQVMGVFSPDLCTKVAEVLKTLGAERVLVVSAEDGLDEFSLSCATRVAELLDGKITEYSVLPSEVGLGQSDMSDLVVSSPEESLALIKAAFSGEDSRAANTASAMISYNAGAAVYVLGIADSLKEGVAMADDAIASGLAGAKLDELAAFSRCCDSVNES